MKSPTGRIVKNPGPNLQNIPVRTEEGKKIKDAFLNDTPTVKTGTIDNPKVLKRTAPKIDGKDALPDGWAHVDRDEKRFYVRRDNIIGTDNFVYSAWRKDHGAPNHEHQTVTWMFGICLGKVGTEVVSEQVWGLGKEDKLATVTRYREDMYRLAHSLILEAFPDARKGEGTADFGPEIHTRTGKRTPGRDGGVVTVDAGRSANIQAMHNEGVSRPKPVSRGPVNKSAIADDDVKTNLQAALKAKPGTHADIAKRNDIPWEGKAANGGVLTMRLLNALRAKAKRGEVIKW